MFNFLFTYFTEIISAAGYAGVSLLMAAESMILPVPSEAVMPFAGFLWYSGKMTFVGILIASTLGSIVGSIISYYIGLWGGRVFIEKYGKYFLLKKSHLELTERFFKRFGSGAIFICRFIPIVRHLISIPAGIGRMPFLKFIVYTTVGAAIWNSFLACCGYYLGSRWSEIERYGAAIDKVVLVILFVWLVYWLVKKRLGRKK